MVPNRSNKDPADKINAKINSFESRLFEFPPSLFYRSRINNLNVRAAVRGLSAVDTLKQYLWTSSTLLCSFVSFIETRNKLLYVESEMRGLPLASQSPTVASVVVLMSHTSLTSPPLPEHLG